MTQTTKFFVLVALAILFGFVWLIVPDPLHPLVTFVGGGLVFLAARAYWNTRKES